MLTHKSNPAMPQFIGDLFQNIEDRHGDAFRPFVSERNALTWAKQRLDEETTDIAFPHAPNVRAGSASCAEISRKD
jgi:hypothetical protein